MKARRPFERLRHHGRAIEIIPRLSDSHPAHMTQSYSALPLLACVVAGVLLQPTPAQNTQCDASQFDALTNMWKLEPDQNTRQIPAGELAAERKVMQRVVEMFKSAFVPTGAAGYYGVNYDILPQAVTNKSRYGNTYIFSLSNHRIYCRSGKPVALDVSLGNVSVQVNVHFIGEAEKGDSSVGFSYLPRGYHTSSKTRSRCRRPMPRGSRSWTPSTARPSGGLPGQVPCRSGSSPGANS